MRSRHSKAHVTAGAFVPLRLYAVLIHNQGQMDLYKQAEEKFGKDRAEELRPEIEQLVADLQKLRSFTLEIEDEL